MFVQYFLPLIQKSPLIVEKTHPLPLSRGEKTQPKPRDVICRALSRGGLSHLDHLNQSSHLQGDGYSSSPTFIPVQNSLSPLLKGYYPN
jgi:hypothetical protein